MVVEERLQRVIATSATATATATTATTRMTTQYLSQFSALICLMVSVYVVKHHERRRHAVNMSTRTVQLLPTMQCPMEM